MGEKLLAEIYGKISSSGSNLSDRLEDNLTGNVFGSLRYIPFDKAMKPILSNAVYPQSVANTFKNIEAGFWNSNIKFWPYDDDGELDVLLDFDDVICGIEVKYLSGISSDDGADYSDQNESPLIEAEYEKSRHQLSRESRIISKRGGNKEKVLIFIASSSSCRNVYEDTIKRGLLNKDVKLGYISWQALLIELSFLKLEDEFHNQIIADLIKLLKRKGFEQFNNMHIGEDFYIDASRYFRFDYKPQSAFDFNSSIFVEGDLHYEFR